MHVQQPSSQGNRDSNSIARRPSSEANLTGQGTQSQASTTGLNHSAANDAHEVESSSGGNDAGDVSGDDTQNATVDQADIAEINTTSTVNYTKEKSTQSSKANLDDNNWVGWYENIRQNPPP